MKFKWDHRKYHQGISPVSIHNKQSGKGSPRYRKKYSFVIQEGLKKKNLHCD